MELCGDQACSETTRLGSFEPAGAHWPVAGLKADVQRRGLQGALLVADGLRPNYEFRSPARSVAERPSLGEEREAECWRWRIPERTGSLPPAL